MKHEFTAILEPPVGDDPWWVGRCPEVPGANGQGKTREECLEDLGAAVELMLEYHRDKALENLPEHAVTDRVLVA